MNIQPYSATEQHHHTITTTTTTIERLEPPLSIKSEFYYLLSMCRIFVAFWSSRCLSSLGLKSMIMTILRLHPSSRQCENHKQPDHGKLQLYESKHASTASENTSPSFSDIARIFHYLTLLFVSVQLADAKCPILNFAILHWQWPMVSGRTSPH